MKREREEEEVLDVLPGDTSKKVSWLGLHRFLVKDDLCEVDVVGEDHGGNGSWSEQDF